MNDSVNNSLSKAEIDAFFGWLDKKSVSYSCTRDEFQISFGSQANTQTMRWLCQWLIDTHAKRLPNLSSLVTILKTNEPDNAPPINRPESEVNNQRYNNAEFEKQSTERNYRDEFDSVRRRCARLADRIQRNKLSGRSEEPITSKKCAEANTSPA
tara:strand:- start:4107 stop:4571 length:465 start_codon:yes stop_codon:yes gene_type:complete